MFGSPALHQPGGPLRRRSTASSCRRLKRVISAGAPVPAAVLERLRHCFTPGVQIFTPYGATEALPVCSIGSGEILGETRQ